MARFSDPSDAMYKTYAIDIYSVTTGKAVNFKAFVTNFTDSFACNWNSETGVGRMDPIQTFQSTTRTITLEFDVVAASLWEAKQNLMRCQRLAQMLYPAFAGSTGKIGASMQAPPYFRVKFSNLISKDGSGGGPGAMGRAALASGLFCTIAGMDYSPDFDVGVFTENGKLFPKYVPMTLELTILHDHALGWNNGVQRHKNFKTFPYGMDLRSAGQKAIDEAGLSEEGKAIAKSIMEDGDDLSGQAGEIAAINAQNYLDAKAEADRALQAEKEAADQNAAPEATKPPTPKTKVSAAAKKKKKDAVNKMKKGSK